VPIFVHQSVLDEAGITPETDMQAQGPGAGSGSQTGEDSSDRLSIFEDFIDKLDLGKLDDKDKPDDDSDEKKN
jgi:hypothetical protein